MARMNPIERAQQLALRGEVDAAVSAFEAGLESDQPHAAAALAEIAAYRGQWDEVIVQTARVLTQPGAIETLNVFEDMVALAARAARETGKWPVITRAAEAAQAALTGAENLTNYADAAARLALWGAGRGTGGPIVAPELPQDEAKRSFDQAVEQMNRKKKKFASAAARADHLFALAHAYGFRAGAVDIFDAERGALPTLFDNVIFLAASLTRRQRVDEAWRAVSGALPRWWPVEVSQVAPVVLLTDASLSVLMTPERCASVLQQPRGPQA